jgi:hypothetical protein
LLFSIIITDYYLLNRTEIIIYNSSQNPGIHLIQGKKNFIITDAEIKEEDMRYYPGVITKHKLGLDPPVFLVSNDSLFNENILMKNKLIFFEGKTISFNKNLSDLNNTKLPDYIINPITNNINNIDYELSTVIISNKRFINKDKAIPNRIHYTSMKGAFRKNW